MKISNRAFLGIFIGVFLSAQSVWGQAATPDPDAIPIPVAMLDSTEDDITNFLLLGSDTAVSADSGRTDVMVIVSVNHAASTVSMLSVPRDLYVYIPEHQVYRINSAFGYGQQEGEGQGYALLIETIRYNLGLTIDYYARVDFNGFQEIVDSLGGVDLSVDCGIQDWRLTAPELDPTVEENWALFTLPIGVHHLDGASALWYARSRRTSSDFDRGRRHQALLRAMWRRVRSLDLLTQMQDIYPQVLEIIDTNIPSSVMVQLAGMAATLDTERIASYTFRPNIEVFSWRSPEGSSVQAPHAEAVARLIGQFLQPPTSQQLAQEHARIEIVNASGFSELAQVAADRLAWEGFVPSISPETERYREYTRLYDFTGQSKGSSLQRLVDVLRVGPAQVEIEPQAERDVDFRVVLGGDYYACTYNVMAPAAVTTTGE